MDHLHLQRRPFHLSIIPHFNINCWIAWGKRNPLQISTGSLLTHWGVLVKSIHKLKKLELFQSGANFLRDYFWTEIFANLGAKIQIYIYNVQYICRIVRGQNDLWSSASEPLATCRNECFFKPSLIRKYLIHLFFIIGTMKAECKIWEVSSTLILKGWSHKSWIIKKLD